MRSIEAENSDLMDVLPKNYNRFENTLLKELLNREMFYTLTEAEVLLELWRIHYNTKRPHSSLGYRPPVPEAIQPQ